MKELSKWQIISFISRGVAMLLGLIQSLFIVRLLTVSEWGLVQLAISIGGALGIYQHLGLASASTREVSAAKDNKEIFKIFITSGVIRYLVTIPIVIGLFFYSGKISTGVYHNPEIELPLKLYAIVLLFQGFQSILNSVIAGTKRFKHLFLYQALIAVVSVALYVPFVFLYRVNGYFYALLGFNIIATLTLAYIAFNPMKKELELPDLKDFKRLFKELFSISIGIYLVKIIYTNWEKLGPNLLGLNLDADIVGYFGFALLYAKKLMNVSDAVTDVNLPVFSDKFVHDMVGFKNTFAENFNKLFVFIVFAGSAAVYWAPEIVRLVVGGDKYDPALPLILPLVFAFVLYSFVNIVKSSVIIPAKLVKEMVLSFIILILGTLVFFYTTKVYLGNLTSMAYGLVFGAFLSFLLLMATSQVRLRFKFITHDHVLLLVEGLAIAYTGGINNLWIKILVFIVLTGVFLYGTYIARFINKSDLQMVINKFSKIRGATI